MNSNMRDFMKRDATASWSGYLYQSILGLIVALETVLHSDDQNCIGTLVYEDMEDFSIQLFDENSDLVVHQTHQAKYKNSETRSDYYDAIREMMYGKGQRQGVLYYLNTSADVDFTKSKIYKSKPIENLNKLKYIYRNGADFLSGGQCVTYLENLIGEVSLFMGREADEERRSHLCALLISYVDKIIIETKERRAIEMGYRRTIEFSELKDIILNSSCLISEELCVAFLKKKFLRAFYLYLEAIGGDCNNRLSHLYYFVLHSNDDVFISFIRRLEIHRDTTSLIELMASISEPEKIQEVLLEILYSTNEELDHDDLKIEKNQCAYRPTSLRLGDGRAAEANLSLEHIPIITENLNRYDIRGYFHAKYLVVSGNTVQNINNFKISNSGAEQSMHIGRAEFNNLININDAIRKINDDE